MDGRTEHFIVAYDIDSSGIHALDGTTGKQVLVRVDRISGFLSGYALVRKASFLATVLQHGMWLFPVLLAANVVLLRNLSRRWRLPRLPDHDDTT